MTKAFYIRNRVNGQYWHSTRTLGWTGEWSAYLDDLPHPTPYPTIEEAEKEIEFIFNETVERFTTLCPPEFLEIVTIYQKEKA